VKNKVYLAIFHKDSDKVLFVREDRNNKWGLPQGEIVKKYLRGKICKQTSFEFTCDDILKRIGYIRREPLDIHCVVRSNEKASILVRLKLSDLNSMDVSSSYITEKYKWVSLEKIIDEMDEAHSLAFTSFFEISEVSKSIVELNMQAG